MARRGRRIVWVTAWYVALAAAAAGGSGCILIAAGAAAGGAVGYAYYEGKVCGTYYAGFNDTWTALHTALAELGMPVVAEQAGGSEYFVESRTANGERVRIYVDTVTGKIPAESPLTRICVRVATFGDEPVSNRILDQVGAHLVPGPASAPPQATFGPPQTPPPPLADAGPPAQTAPPPILPSEPSAVRAVSK